MATMPCIRGSGLWLCFAYQAQDAGLEVWGSAAGQAWVATCCFCSSLVLAADHDGEMRLGLSLGLKMSSIVVGVLGSECEVRAASSSGSEGGGLASRPEAAQVRRAASHVTVACGLREQYPKKEEGS